MVADDEEIEDEVLVGGRGTTGIETEEEVGGRDEVEGEEEEEEEGLRISTISEMWMEPLGA